MIFIELALLIGGISALLLASQLWSARLGKKKPSPTAAQHADSLIRALQENEVRQSASYTVGAALLGKSPFWNLVQGLIYAALAVMTAVALAAFYGRLTLHPLTVLFMLFAILLVGQFVFYAIAYFVGIFLPLDPQNPLAIHRFLARFTGLSQSHIRIVSVFYSRRAIAYAATIMFTVASILMTLGYAISGVWKEVLVWGLTSLLSGLAVCFFRLRFKSIQSHSFPPGHLSNAERDAMRQLLEKARAEPEGSRKKNPML